jgi:asparagine synthase (glutamine-hydrolysing)
MCGITLAFNKSQNMDLEGTIRRMTNQLYHRGPDDSGYLVDCDYGIALGHRRLSILDLSNRGHQPMSYKDNNLVISFNGEIYNFKEIRDKLLAKGYVFNSGTDTEVILAGYAEWGENCVEKFNGMWAFALLDKQSNKILCSRDRVGIKPLYYTQNNGKIFIASEIKAILAAGITARVNLEGLNEYFSFQNIISSNTLFDGIMMLPAGNNMVIDTLSGSIKIYEYWDMRYKPDYSITENDFVEELKNTFYNSMQRHMISDVEIGATISGGMDSSAIASIASKHFGHIHTFTGYFNTIGIDSEDRSYSEIDDARIISNMFNTVHHERLIVPQDMIDTLPFIIWHLEDPKVGMCYTFFTISQLVSEKVKVNLSGTGGDELFAGYPWRYNLITDKTSDDKFNNIYYDWWCRLIKDNDKISFFNKEVLKKINLHTPRNSYDAIMEKAKNYSPINKALYFDLKTFLHGFLMVEDKMGMAYSIETRFPFLDKELLDFMMKVPDNLKFKDGIGKYLLKSAFQDLLPEDIIHKRKQGFTPPDRTWYKRELKNYIESMLLSKKTLLFDYIDKKAVESIFVRHQNGDDKRLDIWSLLFFEGWCRTFLRGDIVAPCLF